MERKWLSRLARKLKPGQHARPDRMNPQIDRIFDSCKSGIVLLERGRIGRCNPAFADMLGYPVPDLLGRAITDFILPAHLSRIVPVLASNADQAETLLALRGRQQQGQRDVILRSCVAGDGKTLVLSVDDVTDIRHSERAFREHVRRLRVLARQILEVQERERRHLARELHDEIGQELTLIKMCLERIHHDPAAEENREILDTAIAQVSGLTSKVRSLSLELRPSMLDDFGLCAALRWFATRATTLAGVRLRLSLPEAFPRMIPEAETTFFRVAQEALNNLLKHAMATTVDVELCCRNGVISLLVQDDGKGLNTIAAESATAAGSGAGLLGMRERASSIGASLDVTGSPGQGCIVQLSLPEQRAIVDAPQE